MYGNKKTYQKNVFLEKIYPVQAVHLPPTEAVVASTPDKYGMWQAKKGHTIIDFKIEVPDGADRTYLDEDGTTKNYSLPSHLFMKNVGAIKYVLTLFVDYYISGEKAIKYLKDFTFLNVFEVNSTITPNSDLVLKDQVTKELKGFLKKGQSVHVKLDFAPTDYLPAGNRALGFSGSNVLVKVDITNNTKSEINKLKVHLIKRIRTFKKTPNAVDGEDASFEEKSMNREIISTVNYRKIHQVKFIDPYLFGDKFPLWWKGVESNANYGLVVELPLPVISSLYL